MDGNGLISGGGTSRFTITSLNPKLVRQQLREKMTRSLLAESAQMKPDTALIYKGLDDLKVHAGDKRAKVQQINGYMKAFDKGFSDNPFYSFSKEAKGQISGISGIINDPNNAMYEQRKISDDEVIKQANTDKVDKNYIIDGNSIKIYEPETGKVDWISLTAFDENRDKYRPLTPDDNYKLIATKGAHATNPLTYNMSSMDDILTKVKSAFTNLGETKTTSFQNVGDTYKAINSVTNTDQVAEAHKFLNSVLGDADINTLVSEYYKKYPNATYDQAITNVNATLSNYANSKLKLANPATDAGSSDTNIKPDGTTSSITGSTEMTLAHRLLSGNETNYRWQYKPTSGDVGEKKTAFAYVADAADVTDLFVNNQRLQSASTIISKDDNGRITMSRKISDNPALVRLMASAKSNIGIFYIAEKDYVTSTGEKINAGDLVPLSGEGMLADSFVFTNDENRMVITNHAYNIKTNQPASNTIMQKITQYEKDVKDNPILPMPIELKNYYNPATSKGISGQSVNAKPTLSFTAATRLNDNDFMTDEAKKLYENTVGVANDNTSAQTTAMVYDHSKKYAGYDPSSGFSDDIALPTLFIPITDVEELGIMVGDKYSYTPKSNLASQPSGAYNANASFVPDVDKAVNQAVAQGYDVFKKP